MYFIEFFNQPIFVKNLNGIILGIQIFINLCYILKTSANPFFSDCIKKNGEKSRNSGVRITICVIGLALLVCVVALLITKHQVPIFANNWAGIRHFSVISRSFHLGKSINSVRFVFTYNNFFFSEKKIKLSRA